MHVKGDVCEGGKDSNSARTQRGRRAGVAAARARAQSGMGQRGSQRRGRAQRGGHAQGVEWDGKGAHKGEGVYGGEMGQRGSQWRGRAVERSGGGDGTCERRGFASGAGGQEGQGIPV
jgi:hypothetical protein